MGAYLGNTTVPPLRLFTGKKGGGVMQGRVVCAWKEAQMRRLQGKLRSLGWESGLGPDNGGVGKHGTCLRSSNDSRLSEV